MSVHERLGHRSLRAAGQRSGRLGPGADHRAGLRGPGRALSQSGRGGHPHRAVRNGTSPDQSDRAGPGGSDQGDRTDSSRPEQGDRTGSWRDQGNRTQAHERDRAGSGRARADRRRSCSAHRAQQGRDSALGGGAVASPDGTHRLAHPACSRIGAGGRTLRRGSGLPARLGTVANKTGHRE